MYASYSTISVSLLGGSSCFRDALDAASDGDSEETAFIRLAANRTGNCRYYFRDIDVFVFVFFNLCSNQPGTLSVFREMVVRPGRCG